MGIAASRKNKLNNDNITFCIVCYENDIKSQRLVCGHAFCYDCILSLYDYEESPRCPLCRQFICVQTNKPLNNRISWLKIGQKTANCTAIAMSCCLFCYNILPTMQGYFQHWDVTMIHGLLNEFRIEYGRVKETWF